MPVEPLRIFVVADITHHRTARVWDEVNAVLRHENIVRVGECLDRKVTIPKTDIDLVVVVGGDGAILRACRRMRDDQLSILGVNGGRLGFLADLSPKDLAAKLDAIIERKFEIHRYQMFECLLSTQAGEERHLGLNEVVVSCGAAARMIDIELQINGELATTYSADGVMICTPVGSTAYNLAAGGPILRQTLRAFAITPICPHTLTNRPIVESAESVFRLRVPNAPDGATLVIDGQTRRLITNEDSIEVRKASVSLMMAKVEGHNYYATLFHKLGWAGQNPNLGG